MDEIPDPPPVSVFLGPRQRFRSRNTLFGASRPQAKSRGVRHRNFETPSEIGKGPDTYNIWQVFSGWTIRYLCSTVAVLLLINCLLRTTRDGTLYVCHILRRRTFHNLGVSNDSDLQRELRALVLLSEDQGDLHSWPCPPDLWQVVCLGDIKLSNESHQECLDLHEPTWRAVFSVLGRGVRDMKCSQRTRTASLRSS